MPMALESWLTKVRSAMSKQAAPPGPMIRSMRKKSSVGILALEVGSLMSKLLRMWRAVGDASVARLRHETIHLDGIRKVVSDDDDFLLGLACAELVDALRAASESVAALAARCADPGLRDFRDAFSEFAETGRDRHRWVCSSKDDMDARAHKMERQVATTTALRRAMEELAEAEHGLRRQLHLVVVQCKGKGGHHRRSLSASNISVAAEQQQLIFSKKQEVKQLKQASLWGCTLDAVVASMARAAFTTLARIKLVFGSLTLSSMSMESQVLTPAPGTLGAAALAPRYAAVVVAVERMVRSPRLVGPEERDELYGMLTASVRAQLRGRLRGTVAAADPELAAQWRAALAGILEWLAPMAHATMRWQAERSFEIEQRTAVPGGVGGVLLLQTLHMADRHKVEAAVVELLVGLNYVCRFHKEMMTCCGPPAMASVRC
ncbi:hypothetical protein HU200_030235 [Digitaria exilis]|uniref:Uncharacterized protein n=1 Tax=Digitaria exilis TaxID=1010633 RepID=A0A835BQ06_9POAL|nr:hypothetical protein HU200_030235 [Digitaria exilis]